MKQIVFSILIMSIGLRVSAQQAGEVNMREISIQKSGENIEVRFKAEIGEKAALNDYKLVLTPILYHYKDSMCLKPIVVYTRKSRIIRNRELISAGSRAVVSDEYVTGNHSVVDYFYSTPFKKWMNEGDIRLNRTLSGCCNEHDFSSIQLASNLQLLPPVIISSPKEETKEIAQLPPATQHWTFSKQDMIIDFSVSRTNINLDLFENRVVLDEVVEVLYKLIADAKVSLSKIEITGYASPEGALALNQKLSHIRSIALKKYLQEQIPSLSDSLFNLVNGGENWQGLRSMVEASDMKYKKEVLNIIDNVPVEIDSIKNTSRKKQLMDLKGGRPYNYMSAHFFPKLRNACYLGVCYVNGKEIE